MCVCERERTCERKGECEALELVLEALPATPPGQVLWERERERHVRESESEWVRERVSLSDSVRE